MKYKRILTLIAKKLNYFDPENIITCAGGQKRSKTDFRIKICGDGTNIGRTLTLLNFCFTVLNDEINCIKAKGNYTIGVFEIADESYMQLHDCLLTLIRKIESIKCIELEGVLFNIQLFFGGDMKFLLNIYGINAANSNLPCLWCKCNSLSFHLVIYFIIDNK